LTYYFLKSSLLPADPHNTYKILRHIVAVSHFIQESAMKKSINGADGLKRFSRSSKLKGLFSSIFVAFVVFGPLATVFAATFTGTNTGAIPDGGTPNPTCGAPRNIAFAVSGFSNSVGAVSVSFTMNPAHTWIGDLQVSLIAPNSTTHLLFSRVGANTATDFGDDANLSGTYTFNDIATQNIWTVAASNGTTGFNIPAGSYRTQAAGPDPTDSPGPAFTSINAAFVSVPPASVNGTWTLRFLDCAAGDTGTVSAASLTLLSVSAAPAGFSGRVSTRSGAGIKNALVTVSGGNLSAPITRITNTFGYYRFDGLEAGQSYVVSVLAKQATFDQPSILVNLIDNLAGVDFVSN